jgi:type IV pilus biogenesis protein PilP
MQTEFSTRAAPAGNTARGSRRSLRQPLQLALLLAVLAAWPSARAELTAEDLTQIEAETTLLKAQARKLDAKAQIASKQAELERLAAPSAAGDPTIVAIEGIGRGMLATLALENGSLLDVHVGDALPNGMKVVSIRQSEVVVQTRSKKRVRLAFEATPAATPAYPAPPGGRWPALPLPSKGGR